MNTKELHFRLISAATAYDEKQSKKKYYNHYALGIYFQRIDDVCRDIEGGKSIRQALLDGFNDRFLDVMLKAAGEAPFSIEEKNSQKLCY